MGPRLGAGSAMGAFGISPGINEPQTVPRSGFGDR